MKNITLSIIISFILMSGSSQTALKVDADGNVGIGVTSPLEKLHVAGNIFINDGDVVLKSNSQNKVILRGLDGSQRFSFATNATTSSSASFNTFWGDETHGFANETPSRAGEVVFSGKYLKFVPNKPLDGFGSLAFEVKADGDTYAYGDLYANGTLISSDKKLKRSIQPLNYGLEQILSMNPKQYFYNGKANTNTSRIHTGVIAQEMKKIVPESVVEYSYVDHDRGINEKYLAVDEGMIKFMLINAIKDQHDIISTQETRISELEQNLTALEKSIHDLYDKMALSEEFLNTSAMNQRSSIKQNTPNPFNHSTQIEYIIPLRSSNAKIVISSISGLEVKQIPITSKGEGYVTLNKGEISPGTYMYSLIVDGSVVNTHKMIVH